MSLPAPAAASPLLAAPYSSNPYPSFPFVKKSANSLIYRGMIFRRGATGHAEGRRTKIMVAHTFASGGSTTAPSISPANKKSPGLPGPGSIPMRPGVTHGPPAQWTRRASVPMRRHRRHPGRAARHRRRRLRPRADSSAPIRKSLPICPAKIADLSMPSHLPNYVWGGVC